MKKIFSLILIFLGSSCKIGVSEGFRVGNAKVISGDDVPDDILLPSDLWELFLDNEQDSSAATKKSTDPNEKKSNTTHGESDGQAQGGKAHEGSNGIAGSTLANKIFLYSEVQVYLTEKNPKVLLNPAYRFNFPKGGGTIDLANFVTKNVGSFYVGFEFPEWEQSASFKAVFLSNTQKRRIGGQVHGAGCNKYMEITPMFQNKMKTEGIKVNTLNSRHSTVLGGTFIFSTSKGSDKYITQVSFVDSSNKRLFCNN